MMIKNPASLCALWLMLLLTLAASPATAEPDTAEPAPSEWLEYPFAMLGIDHGPHAFQLTPEGWVRTATTTLIVDLDGQSSLPWRWTRPTPGVATTSMTGSRPAPGEPQVELVLAATALPGLRHDLRTVAPQPDHFNIGSEVANPVLIMRVTTSAGNAAGSPATAPTRLVLHLWADCGQDSGNLFGPALAARPDPARTPRWRDGAPGTVAIADSLVLLAPAAPDSIHYSAGPAGDTGRGVIRLVYLLRGRETYEFRLPYFAVPTGNLDRLAGGDDAALIKQVGDEWEARLTSGVRLQTPEPVVAATALASLYHLLAGSFVARGDEVAIIGGTFFYRQIFARDAAFVIVAMDRFGFHREARTGLEFLLTQQRPSGEIFTQTGQRDGNGQVLWALGEHLVRTGDGDFARTCFAQVEQLVGRLRYLLASAEPDRSPFAGLLPRTTLRDGEQVDRCHIVGYNLWTYAGLRAAAQVARVAGAEDSVAAWTALAGAFAATQERHLNDLLARTGSILTPAFEGLEARALTAGFHGETGGLDWGNLQIVFPCRLWRADEPRLRPSLDLWCGRLREGLYPYPYGGDRHLVHHYLTTSVAHTLLESGTRSDRRQLLTIFYDGLLGHATGTGGGSEILDTRSREVWPPENIQPHNTFSARYLLLLRDMLVHERGDTLVLGAGLSPAWVAPGNRVAMTGAATAGGWVDVTFDAAATLGDGTTAGQSILPLEVNWSSSERMPAQRRRPAHLPQPRTPVTQTGPPRPFAAVVCPAPLGFEIVGVSDLCGSGATVLAIDDRRVVLSAGATGATLALRGAADPDLSFAAARRRLLRR